jgi:hypothetical protein
VAAAARRAMAQLGRVDPEDLIAPDCRQPNDH